MRLIELRVDQLRNLRQEQLILDRGINLIAGANGAGKTSVIEAVHLLSHGRSFRSPAPDSLIRVGSEALEVFCRIQDGVDREFTLGARRSRDGWVLRRGGEAVPLLADFVRNLAAITVEPNSHALITGAAEQRRRYLDWLLFHVEPAFLGVWRRYLRALKQRNAALQGRASDAELQVWEAEMASLGDVIHAHRANLLERLAPRIEGSLAVFAPELLPLRWSSRSGWPAQYGSLAEALIAGRPMDRERGFSGRGPHRADWRVSFPGGLGQAELSRGQAKLVSLACLLGQADAYREYTGHWPVLLFDDLASELDSAHQQQVLGWLVDSQAQVLISGTEVPDAWSSTLARETPRFHVEQGEVRRLL